MNVFDKVTSAPKPKTCESQQIAYAYAVILTVFLLTQLFTFDKFIILLKDFSLPGGAPMAHFLGSVIVTSELLALPFLLGQKLSPLMRIISMILGWFVPFLWLSLSLWLIVTAKFIPNFGVFGTVIDLLPGWWTIFICIALGIMAAWASWGMWPIARRAHK